MKIKLKKGDLVQVIAGDARHEKINQGTILSIDLAKNRAIVEGLNLVSKHTKPNAKNPQGGIVKQEASIHISNLMLVQAGKLTRVGRKLDEKTGKLVRFAKQSKEVIK